MNKLLLTLKNFFKRKRNLCINITIFLLIFVFLFSFFKPNLILSDTLTNGGDMGTHTYPAQYMKNYLLPHGKLIGWSPGWFAGFPIFQFYFPLPFVAIGILSYLIPFNIAFKLITILGVFTLPITAFISAKLLKSKFPGPIIFSILTLVFLFNETNSMWGGNIPSTLAGEFSFSISLTLTVLFIGTIYYGMKHRKMWIMNSIILSLLIMTHIYTAIFAVIVLPFFVIFYKRDIKDNLRYLGKLFFLTFLLTSFWTLPLLSKLQFTSPYGDSWSIELTKAITRNMLLFLPFFIYTIFTTIKERSKKSILLIYSFLIAILLFFISPKIGLINIRFIPIIQILYLFISSYGIMKIVNRLKLRGLVPFIVIFFTILLLTNTISFIPHWIEWNYEGYENKEPFGQFQNVTNYLSKRPGNSRVEVEWNPKYDPMGTERTFELLPMFSGNPTLEGLYLESSITSPFIYYMQCEVSGECTNIYDNDLYTGFNLTMASRHFKLFNVGYYVASRDVVLNALEKSDVYRKLKSYELFDLYKYEENKGQYVEVPKYKPVAVLTDNREEIAMEWFTDMDMMDVPLVFVRDREELKNNFIEVRRGNLSKLSRVSTSSNCSIEEEVKNERIKINTTCVGEPHLIKISYFPNWKVKGAKKVYLVSPSFMMIFPNQENVELYYGETLIDKIGKYLTFTGIILIILLFFRNFIHKYGRI